MAKRMTMVGRIELLLLLLLLFGEEVCKSLLFMRSWTWSVRRGRVFLLVLVCGD